MDNNLAIHQMISKEVTQDDPNVRESFLKRYKGQVNKFIQEVSRAFREWKALDSLTRKNERRKHVSALVFAAINLHVLSMKLFLSGYIIAAGNLQRQVIEMIALAVLCSCKSLDVLDRFVQGNYLAINAVRDLFTHAQKLNLMKRKKAVETLKQIRKYYHPHSHPSFITLATSMSDRGWVLGPSFDGGKTEFYDNEMAGQIFISHVFRNFVAFVKENVSKW